MQRSLHPRFAALALACACALALPMHLPAQAQGKSSAATAPLAPGTVTVVARTNAGNLPYRAVYAEQRLLQGYLPLFRRVVDMSWRISFAELSEPEQDAYAPPSWSVALVDDDFEQTVPIRRGGYFLLPALPSRDRLPARMRIRPNPTLMFKDQSRAHHIGVAWLVHVGGGQRLAYADFGRALDEVHGAQNSISPSDEALELVRAAQYDGLKACFKETGGRLLVDGRPTAGATVGNCVVLKFDPADNDRGGTIEFRGPLDVVSIVETGARAALAEAPPRSP